MEILRIEKVSIETMLPIWAVVLIEFCFAYSLECLLGSPLSFKMASKMFDPRRNCPPSAAKFAADCNHSVKHGFPPPDLIVCMSL